MIEINLLPEELKRKGPGDNILLKKLFYICGIWVFGIMVFMVLFLFAGINLRRHQISVLLYREKDISGRFLEIDGLIKEMASVKTKMNVLDELTKRKFLWSQKLNQLSDLILPGIWFTAVYTDLNGALVIEGNVVSKYEEEMSTVGKFMKALKDNEEFFKDFKAIKLESVQRNLKENRESVFFKIALYFE